MGSKKKWSQEEKLSIVLDGIKSKGVREICREYGISNSQYYKWRDEAPNAAKTAFESRNSKSKHKSHENECNQVKPKRQQKAIA